MSKEVNRTSTNECEPKLKKMKFHLDIGDYMRGSNVDDQMKYDYLTNHWVPSKDFVFPKHVRTVSGKTFHLSFQRAWLEKFKWLAYSPDKDGAFCKSCLIFAPDVGGGSKLLKLVNEPMQNLKSALEDLSKHASRTYHITAQLHAENFCNTHTTGNVVEQMNSARAQQADGNRRALASIINVVKFCGRQNIALRGHIDHGVLSNPTNFETEMNEGNFRALLRFRISSGDQDLLNYVQNAPLNALYTSPQIQNKIITLCGEMIRETLVKKINKSKYFAMLADETSDIGRIEQFSICARYVQNEHGICTLREGFLGFVEAVDLSGQALAELLMSTLTSWGLELRNIVGQGYDGVANMSGCFRGVQAVDQAYPKACYTHCCSHSLNLVLSHACGGEGLKRTVRSIRDVVNFFSNSPKRTGILKNAIIALLPQSRHTRSITFCETRWVERHESITVFCELYSAVVYSLGQIEECRDRDAADKADEFKYRIMNADFICHLRILDSILGITYRLSVILQSKDLDIIGCCQMLNDVKAVLQHMLDNAQKKFSTKSA
ncbi:zinc finger MYM-type protein 1-like [Styela clava]